MIYKSLGIVIKRTNYSEADRILTIFTEKYGKIRVIAKGIRKIKSKLSGNVELFCLSNLNIAEGKNLDVLTGALIEKCYFNIRNNLSSTRIAQYFGELVDKLTEENDPHPEIYNLLDEALENLHNIQSEIIIPYFEWNALSFLGYHPELNNCINCGKRLLENEKNYFNFSRGGLACFECQKNDIYISNDTIKLLRIFLKHKIMSLIKLKIDKHTLNEINKITRNYINIKSEKDIHSQRFLK